MNLQHIYTKFNNHSPILNLEKCKGRHLKRKVLICRWTVYYYLTACSSLVSRQIRLKTLPRGFPQCKLNSKTDHVQIIADSTVS